MKQADLINGIDYYINESGFLVLTAKYHLEKGFCCGMGCMHCPYNFENVPEPHRSLLILSKEKNKVDFSPQFKRSADKISKTDH